MGSQQQNIIIGTLLGDGFLERNGKFVRLVIDHSSNQSLYVRWKGKHLCDFKPTIKEKSRFDARTGKYQQHTILRTRTSPDLERYYTLFYENGIKRVPEELPMILNGQNLAIWIMDDGYKRNDCNALRINSQSYDRQEHEIIVSALSQLSINAKIQKHKKSFVTYIPSASMSRLRKAVKPYMMKSMEYKIA